MTPLTPQYLIILFNDYCKGGFVGNVGWGYNLLKHEILKRISNETQNEILNEEVEKHKQYIENLMQSEPDDYNEFSHHDLPVDWNNAAVKSKAQDRIVKLLFEQIQTEGKQIETIIKL